MEAAQLAAIRTRVAMVRPVEARVGVGVADLRAQPDGAAELVDQAHVTDSLRILAARDGWCFVQSDDHYFGWIREQAVFAIPALGGRARVVAVTLAAVRASPEEGSTVLDHAPAGTFLPETRHYLPEGDGLQREMPPKDLGPWTGIAVRDPGHVNRFRLGYMALGDTVLVDDIPQRAPAAADLIATAEAFLGVPYLWGGTTALGMDCSGFVQQVFRLNGVRLDRDADQQATEGRATEDPCAGDLVFFGTGRVTHVALATGDRTYIHAPESGRAVQRGELSDGRTVLAVRRYLP